jgi:hypothetical protein
VGDPKKIVFTKRQYDSFHELMTGRFESTGHTCLFLSSYVGLLLGSAVAGGAACEEGRLALAEAQETMRASFERAGKGSNGAGTLLN